MATKTAAIVTINDPGGMTKRGRKEIAKWLRKRADDLVEHGPLLTESKFTARYLYDDETSL